MDAVALLPGTVEQLIARTLRVPAFDGPEGNSEVVARQLDVALLSEGFAAPAGLLAHLAGLEPGAAFDAAVLIVGAVRRRIGSHVEANPYFVDFPHGVPSTEEFWAQCLAGHGVDPTRAVIVDLTTLPAYGRYQHTFAEMLARREPFVDSPDDSAGHRRTVLVLGGPVTEEARRAYAELAGTTTPPTPADRELLADLAAAFVGEESPLEVPVRENRAVIDSARLAAGRPLALCDTITDVLRVAVRASGGDVALAEPGRFRSFARRERRVLLTALDRIVGTRPSALADVTRRRERWKRLGERLHPHEHAARLPHAARLFAVARGEEVVRSATARAELAAGRGDTVGAAEALVPGVLVRSADRLLRATRPDDADRVLGVITRALPDASGRVLYALRSHLENAARPNPERLFVTRRGRPHLEPETRGPLVGAAALATLVDDEIARRLPAAGTLVVDPAILSVALPLSGKATADGHAVLPRGTVAPLPGDAEVLRFFVHWRQAVRRTDLDLSVLLLDDGFETLGYVSWTNLHGAGIVHSGDLIDAAEGATEFIDVTLAATTARYVVPQVNVYSGEGFDEVAESLFGYMTFGKGSAEHGAPFDPRAVRARSELRGTGRITLPVAFARTDDGWRARWMHLRLRGAPIMNQVETNRVTTASLVRDAMTRRMLTVRHHVDLWRRHADRVVFLPDVEVAELTGQVTYLGPEPIEGLPEGARSITLDRLNSLIPV